MARRATTPAFAPSVKVSDYLMGYRRRTVRTLEQLQFNPPNLPMFTLGTVPFIGDYIDVDAVAGVRADGHGKWAYNTAATGDAARCSTPRGPTTATCGRRATATGRNYTPPTLAGRRPAAKPVRPDADRAGLQAGNAGSRNQNIYTARITAACSSARRATPSRCRPTLQRGFVVFAQNATRQTQASA